MEPRVASQMARVSSAAVRRSVAMVERLWSRDECTTDGNNNTCEKPITTDRITWIVVISIGSVFFLAAIGTLVWLHCRRRRRDKREDAMDPMELSDYGLEGLAAKKQMRQKPGAARWGQRNSLHSLAPSLPAKDDPFGSTAELAYFENNRRPAGNTGHTGYDRGH